MSLAIKFGNFLDPAITTSGFVYIDAVTGYTSQFKGQLTSHPIGSGSLISDHFIRSNPTFQISGVISGADISLGRYNITDGGENRPTNVNNDVDSVKIKGENTLLSLLPQSTSSYFVDAASSITTSTQPRRQKLSEIRFILEKLFENNQVQIVKLFEYEDSVVVRMIDNLVMNDLSFREDPDNGYALYISISLEQATFTKLKVDKLTKKDRQELDVTKVAEPIKDPAKPLSNVGNKDGAGSLIRQTEEQKAAIAKAQSGNSDAAAILKITEAIAKANLGGS